MGKEKCDIPEWQKEEEQKKKEPIIVTVPETVIIVDAPFEPYVSDPKAVEAAEGMGHFERGDAWQLLKGSYNGLVNVVNVLQLLSPGVQHTELPKASIDPRYGGAAIVGEQLAENLALEGAAAVPAAGRLLKNIFTKRTYIVYALKDSADSIRYIGRASGIGTAEQVLYGRLTKGHDVFVADENLFAEILSEQSSRNSNLGAESVYHDYYQQKGHNLLNDPKNPPLGTSGGKIEKTRMRIQAFFEDW